MNFVCNRLNGFISLSVKGESGTASANTDTQWSKQEACFARATRVCLPVNNNTSVTSGE